MLNKIKIKNQTKKVSKFCPGDFGKNERERGLDALLFFSHFKRALELLVPVRIKSSYDILGHLGRCDIWEKNK